MNEIQFLLYDLPDNEGNVQVVIKGGTLWMTQKAMAKLYAVNVPDISKHLKNIYETGEQKIETTVSKMEIVQVFFRQRGDDVEALLCFLRTVRDYFIYSSGE